MHLSSNGRHNHRFAQATLLVLALALTIFGIAGLAGQAKAGPVTLKFDNGRVSIGAVIQDKVILPADDKFPSPDLPTPQRTDIELTGTETDGNLSFPANTNTGAQFPYMHVLSPTDPTLKVPLTFRLRDPGLTGTYDAATGATNLSGKMDVVVIVGTGATFPIPDLLIDTGTPPLNLFGRCRIANVPVNFSTETKAPFTGQRFAAENFGVNGAMTTSWDDLPTAKIENGTAEQKALCEDQLDTIIHGPGGLWLSNAVVTPVPQPVPEPTCADDLRLCPLPTYVEISGVKVTPKKKTVKAGKSMKIKVKVKNAGTRDSKKTRVALRSSNRLVRVRKSITLKVLAGSSTSKTVTVKVKGKARGKARVTASINGYRSGSTLKIKAKKRRK
jgi:hypothetical protein